MTELSVGKEVLSQCSKCKLILAHIIVTMKDSKTPDKTLCKTCKSTHSYKAPGATKKKTSISTVIKTAKAKNHTKTSESVNELWTKAVNKTTLSSKSYTIKGNFLSGDLIEHPTFGTGIVEKLIDSNKIEVLFKDEYRTLIHNK